VPRRSKHPLSTGHTRREPYSVSGKRYEPYSRSMCQLLNNWYETYQTACGLKEGCLGKLDRCYDYKICGKLPVNKTVETLMISTFLSVDCLQLKTDCMLNKLLHTESASRYIHYMQVKMEYCYVGKGS
jgi:hypothetical protein